MVNSLQKRCAAAAIIAMLGCRWGVAANPCLPCHVKEVAAFEKTAMAHSVSRAASRRQGSFQHDLSGTKFVVSAAPDKTIITMTRRGLTATYQADYVIGSGSHAYGFLTDIAGYLYQAPVAFYSKRGAFDMAPGYESEAAPEFSRPVTVECLECHADKPRLTEGTLNHYETPAVSLAPISCERCHGDGTAHRKQPSLANIVNPAKLAARARDSVCEQCHLSGEVRILNPGRKFGDFQAGQELEDVFTVYVRDGGIRAPESSIKVIGHSEQLARSACSQKSVGKLWCGTCHNPHRTIENRTAFYRERCLECHGAQVIRQHSKPVTECVSCHMPARKTKDGAHTVFTDHRIARTDSFSAGTTAGAPGGKLAAWHEPAGVLAVRNLGLANIEIGQREKSPELLQEGAQQTVEAMKSFPNDAVLLTKLGVLLMQAGKPMDAVDFLRAAVDLEPGRGGSHANLGNCYKEARRKPEAVQELERAIELDPSLETAYRSLGEIYFNSNETEKVRLTFERFLKWMPGNITARRALQELGPR